MPQRRGASDSAGSVGQAHVSHCSVKSQGQADESELQPVKLLTFHMLAKRHLAESTCVSFPSASCEILRMSSCRKRDLLLEGQSVPTGHSGDVISDGKNPIILQLCEGFMFVPAALHTAARLVLVLQPKTRSCLCVNSGGKS